MQITLREANDYVGRAEAALGLRRSRLDVDVEKGGFELDGVAAAMESLTA